MKTNVILAIALTMLWAGAARGQLLVAWDVGSGGLTDNWPATATNTGLVNGAVTLSRGAGTGSIANTYIGASGINQTSLAAAITGNDYLGFSLTAAGSDLRITNFCYRVAQNAANGNVNFALLFDTDTDFSSGAVTAKSWTIPDDNTQRNYTFVLDNPITVSAAATVYVRIYAWGNGTSGSIRSANSTDGADGAGNEIAFYGHVPAGGGTIRATTLAVE
jgi:hypothetical protein